MIINVTSSRIISEIQSEFNTLFPFLKIEFFCPKLSLRNTFGLAQLVSNKKTIGEAQTIKTDGTIEIQRTTKVYELEKKFKDEFSLTAQVFRKSGNLWIETTMTDKWTLEQQNKHGKEISMETIKTEEANDYDLARDADH